MLQSLCASVDSWTMSAMCFQADMRQLRESVIDLALEGMGDAADVNAAMDEDADTQGIAVASETEPAAEGNFSRVERTAASQCTVNRDLSSSAVGAMASHDRERDGHGNRPHSTEELQGMGAEIADAELDDLVNERAADDEFWDDDAFDDMMVTA